MHLLESLACGVDLMAEIRPNSRIVGEIPMQSLLVVSATTT
jgi:hypothetical protein